MKKQAYSKLSGNSFRDWNVFYLMLAIVAGAFARLFQIGNDVFWFDEINVLQVISRQNLWEAFKLTHEHVMAMPLHYGLVWLIGQFCTLEGWLRFPEAIWGTLAIWISHYIACFYLTTTQSIYTAYLIALSPIMIMYSQELRFYSGMVFFYLLTALLGLKATTENKVSDWIAFYFVSMLGITFHVYVLLSLFFIYAYLLPNLREAKELGVWRKLIRFTIFLLLTFITLLVLFGRLPKESWSLTSQGYPLTVLMAGIGLAAPFPISNIEWTHYSILIFLSIIGLLSLRDDHQKKKIYLLLAIILQILVIFFANLMNRYFLAPRQLIFLLPFFSFYPAIGLDLLYNKLSTHFSNASARKKEITKILPILILVLFTIPALIQYYRLEKGIVKEALPVLEKRWKEGDIICVYPNFDAVTYAYYWRNRLGDSIYPCEDLLKLNQARFIIAPPTWKPVEKGFQLVFIPSSPTLHERWIWEKTTK